MSSPFSVFADILGALGRVTLYNSNPATTGLGYGLGGQGTTAQSSFTPVYTGTGVPYPQPESSAAYAAQQAQAMQAMTQAQMESITYYSTGIVTSSIGLAQARPMDAVVVKSTEAVTRSMELLYDWLTPEQRKQLAVNGFFDVIGGDTGIKYRLYPPANYNIHQLVKDSNETEVKLCFEPKDKMLPKGDIWLCQKLALELDERATLEIANRSATYFG